MPVNANLMVDMPVNANLRVDMPVNANLKKVFTLSVPGNI